MEIKVAWIAIISKIWNFDDSQINLVKKKNIEFFLNNEKLKKKHCNFFCSTKTD